MNTSLIRSALAFTAYFALTLPTAFAQATERVSVDSAGLQGSKFSGTPSISTDGQYVVFLSSASNLVPGDTNQAQDVFVRDRHTGQTSRVSVDSAGLEADGSSSTCAISGDGRYVAFSSIASNLVSGDTNNFDDIFLHDRMTGQTTRVSVNSVGLQSNGVSLWAAISADGFTVGFASLASNLVQSDANNEADIFVHDVLTGMTSRISVTSTGGEARASMQPLSISADGRFTAFQSGAIFLVPGDTNGADDIFVHDRTTGLTTRISVDSAGTEGNDSSQRPSVSADGRFVAFHSFSSNLVIGDFNGSADIFVNDRQTGQTNRVSVDTSGVEGNDYSYAPSISDDGRYVAFLSPSTNLVPLDTNFAVDTFVHDLQTGQTNRVSVDSSGVEGNNGSQSWHTISGDGRFVAFESASTNLVPGDTNSFPDVFVHELGPIAFELIVVGHCPGPMTLIVNKASANKNVAFVYGLAGTYLKPTPPCMGVVLGIAQPRVGAILAANAAGTAVLSISAPPFVCGFTVQAVDIRTCTATNTVVL